MPQLLLVSFIWAFSFGLIKGRLSGLDPTAVAAVRLAVASLVFLPWIQLKGLKPSLRWRLIATGGVQFGLMYMVYLQAFVHLQAHEVALFTIFTPLYLTLIDAALNRRWQLRHLAAASVAVVGAAVVLWQRRLGEAIVTGFILVQLSNLCFAAGQLAYRRLRPEFPDDLSDRQAFGWLALGGLAVTLLVSLPATEWTAFRPSTAQMLVLLYLGSIASGLGFFLWAVGSTRVNAGTLAVFNNAKVPLGVACSLIFFQETANIPRLLGGLILLAAAIWLAERKDRSPGTPAPARNSKT